MNPIVCYGLPTLIMVAVLATIFDGRGAIRQKHK